MSNTARLGGLSEPRCPTAEDQAICDSVKAAVEAKQNQKFDTFIAVLVATQIVAGINYFVKINVGAEGFLHARIFSGLHGEAPVLHGVQYPKKACDPLEYF